MPKKKKATTSKIIDELTRDINKTLKKSGKPKKKIVKKPVKKSKPPSAEKQKELLKKKKLEKGQQLKELRKQRLEKEKQDMEKLKHLKEMPKSLTELKWTQDLSVDEPEIDRQHKTLIEHVAKLEKHLTEGEEFSGIRESINFLLKYKKEHFDYEEEYMKRIKYPKFKEHKKIHDKFSKDAEKFKKDFENKYIKQKYTVSFAKEFLKKVHKYLGQWIIDHIKKEDQKYHKYALSLKRETKLTSKPKKFDMSAIKAEIQRDMKGGAQSQILEQRAPLKAIENIKEKKSKAGKGFVATGVPGFDDLFENGIPKGNAILVAGGAGSGKTIFCLQTLSNHAIRGEKCFYMSFEESEDRLIDHMKNFGWDAKKMIKTGKLKMKRMSPFDITRSVDAMLAKEKGELLIDIDPVILPEKFKPDFIVVDSLTAIASAFTGKEDSYRIYIEQLFRFFERLSATAFLITETKQIPEIFSTTGVEEFLADGVIVLYNFKRGDIRENAIEVLKMRGEKHQKKIVAMQISSTGITVYPEQEVFGGVGQD